MSVRLCEFEGCERNLYSRGLCKAHRTQQDRGKELKPLREFRTRAESRERVCEFEGCCRPYKAKGLCEPHYLQRRRGKQLTPISREVITGPYTPETHLWPFIDKSAQGGCWVWTRTINRGYGNLNGVEGTRLVHRVVWEELIGPIPDGKQVDHLCHVTSCCNPEHLRIVDEWENKQNRTIKTAGSGYRNVYRNTKSGGWHGRLKVNGERVYLGTFPTPELASEAVEAYRAEHGIIGDSRKELGFDAPVAEQDRELVGNK